MEAALAAALAALGRLAAARAAQGARSAQNAPAGQAGLNAEPEPEAEPGKRATAGKDADKDAKAKKDAKVKMDVPEARGKTDGGGTPDAKSPSGAPDAADLLDAEAGQEALEAMAELLAQAEQALQSLLVELDSAKEQDGKELESQHKELLPVLLQAAGSQGTPTAVKVVGRIAKMEWGCQALLSSGAVNTLSRIIQDFLDSPLGDYEACNTACTLLSKLARRPDGRRSIASVATKQLSTLLSSPLDHLVAVQTEAALALANCATTASARKAMREEGLIEHISRRIKLITLPAVVEDVSQLGLLSHLLSLLSQAARDPKLATQMLDHSLAPALLGVIKWLPTACTPPRPAPSEETVPIEEPSDSKKGADAKKKPPPKPPKKSKQELAAEEEAERQAALRSIETRLDLVVDAATCLAVCAAASAAWRRAILHECSALVGALHHCAEVLSSTSRPSAEPEALLESSQSSLDPAELLRTPPMLLVLLKLGASALIVLATSSQAAPPAAHRTMCDLVAPALRWFTMPLPPELPTATAAKGKAKPDPAAEEEATRAREARIVAQETAQAAAAHCLAVVSEYGAGDESVSEVLCQSGGLGVLLEALSARLYATRAGAAAALRNCASSLSARDELVADNGRGIVRILQQLDDPSGPSSLRIALADCLSMLGVDSRVRRIMRTLPSELSATEDPIAEPDPEPPPPAPAAKGKSGATPPITPAAPHPRLSKRGVLWTRLSGSIDSRWTVPQPVPYVRVGESSPLKGRELTLSPWQREWGFRGKLEDFVATDLASALVDPRDSALEVPLCSASSSLSKLRYLDSVTFEEKLIREEEADDECMCEVTIVVRWEPREGLPSGLQVLLESAYLESTPELMSAACVALSTCIADAHSAGAAVQLGTIARLCELIENGESPIRVSAAVCLDRLADFDPAVQLWLRGQIVGSTKLASGFIDLGAGRKFLTRSAIAAAGVTRQHEVLLVDFETDSSLAATVQKAVELVDGDDCNNESKIKALSSLVSDILGGSYSYESYQTLNLRDSIEAAKQKSGSDLLQLGALECGGARHRALLFKVLADKLGIYCELHSNQRSRGSHANHAWVVTRFQGGLDMTEVTNVDARVVVDLMHSVGSCYAVGSAEALRYMRADEYAHSTLNRTSRDLFLPPQRPLIQLWP